MTAAHMTAAHDCGTHDCGTHDCGAQHGQLPRVYYCRDWGLGAGGRLVCCGRPMCADPTSRLRGARPPVHPLSADGHCTVRGSRPPGAACSGPPALPFISAPVWASPPRPPPWSARGQQQPTVMTTTACHAALTCCPTRPTSCPWGCHAPTTAPGRVVVVGCAPTDRPVRAHMPPYAPMPQATLLRLQTRRRPSCSACSRCWCKPRCGPSLPPPAPHQKQRATPAEPATAPSHPPAPLAFVCNCKMAWSPLVGRQPACPAAQGTRACAFARAVCAWVGRRQRTLLLRWVTHTCTVR